MLTYQSILPVLTKETGMMHGVLLIPCQKFTKDRDVLIAPNTYVYASKVTRHTQDSFGRLVTHEFMALQYPLKDEWKKPWLCYPMFLSNDDIGAVSSWYCWIFKQGIRHSFGLGAQNIYTGVWQNASQAWDPDDPNSPNNPETCESNRPNIGFGTEWDKKDDNIDTSTEQLPSVNLTWNFSINKSRLDENNYFDCHWVDIFYESLKHYGMPIDSPKDIKILEKPSNIKIGMMFSMSEPDTMEPLPSVLRFLFKDIDVKTYIVKIQILCEKVYNIEIQCDIVNSQV